MNIIFPLKVKPGAWAYMTQVLAYPQQVDQRMDNKICRITETGYRINSLNIKSHYIKQLASDRLYRIQVHGIEDREFLVLESFLEDAGEGIIIIPKPETI